MGGIINNIQHKKLVGQLKKVNNRAFFLSFFSILQLLEVVKPKKTKAIHEESNSTDAAIEEAKEAYCKSLYLPSYKGLLYLKSTKSLGQ